MNIIRKIWNWPESLPTIAPSTMRNLHFWGFVIWTANLPIALSLGWVASVTYVSAASIYANLATHLTGYSAERPTELVSDGDDQ